MISDVLRIWCWTASGGVACLCGWSDATFAQAELHRLRLVEELRLDANAEDFSVVSRVVVGAHGLMAVPLAQDMEIRIYDTRGRRVAAVGRRGSGPGEFQHFGAMTWRGDTLIVDDQRLRRLTFISADGRVLDTRSLPSPLTPAQLGSNSDSTFRYFTAYAAGADRTLLGVAAVASRNGRVTTGPPSWVILALSDGGRARVVAKPPQYADERWSITIAGLTRHVPFAFQPQIVFSVDGSRFAFMTADQSRVESTYAVQVFEANGDTIFTRRYAFRGVRIPAAAVDSGLAAMDPPPAQREGAPSRRFQTAARQRMPVVYSPVERLVLALDGTTWITGRATAAGHEVIVLDRRGTPTASVVLPLRTRVQQASSSHLWVTEVDTFGLASVVRYRLQSNYSSPYYQD